MMRLRKTNTRTPPKFLNARHVFTASFKIQDPAYFSRLRRRRLRVPAAEQLGQASPMTVQG
jgi:hypothetical protein